LAADIFDYYADNAERFLEPVRIDTREGEAAVVSRPLGVLFGVQHEHLSR
jgi:succinate-semialdehyde dehydrogenase / glutarate-semialdehyde dehydrogenase